MFRRKNKVREGTDFTIAKNVASVILIIYALTMMIPFLRLIMVALTEPNEYLNATEAFHIPTKLYWKNFVDAWTVLETGDANMLTMLFNSAWWSFGGAFLEIGTAAMLGYAVAKYKFFGRKAIHAIAVFTMMLPIYGAMAGNYVVLTNLGLYNSPWILLTCCAGFGGTFIMVNSFFKSVPKAYMEAAYIDGANHFQVAFKIMFPQATAPLTAMFIMNLMGRWNNYMTPILYFPDYITIPAGLYTYQLEQSRGYNEPVLYAGLILCMLFPLLLYILFNKKFMTLSIAGGLKG